MFYCSISCMKNHLLDLFNVGRRSFICITKWIHICMQLEETRLCYLEFIFSSLVEFWEFSELFCQSKTLCNVFWWDEIHSYLCAWLQIEHIIRYIHQQKSPEISSKEMGVIIITVWLVFFTLRFRTWCGQPAGMNTASPSFCSNVQGSIPRKVNEKLAYEQLANFIFLRKRIY